MTVQQLGQTTIHGSSGIVISAGKMVVGKKGLLRTEVK